MKRIISKTINGIDYHVLYQKVGAHTYREVLIPIITINEENTAPNDFINIKS